MLRTPDPGPQTLAAFRAACLSRIGPPTAREFFIGLQLAAGDSFATATAWADRYFSEESRS